MFIYNLKLGLKSIRRNPIMSALMVLAIALGIGASMTTLTIFYMMDKNPIAEKNDVLVYVQPDSWDPVHAYSDQDGSPPDQVTYRDAMVLMKDAKAYRQAAMTKTYQIVQSEASGIEPSYEEGRATYSDFFPMFKVPFAYGSAWTKAEDDNSAQVVVLNKNLNDRIFGGENSVGKTLTIAGLEFEVIGVLEHYQPTPKFYDLTNGDFRDAEDFFIPFNTLISNEINHSGNTSCWDNNGPSYQEFLAGNCIWIQYWAELESPSDRQDYQNYLDAYIDESRQTENFPREVRNRISSPSEWLEIQEVVRDDTRVQVGLAFMFLIVCLLNTLGLLLAKFLGKSSEIGLRRALGANRKTLFLQHIIESGLIGVIGGFVGLLLTYAGLYAVNQIYSELERLATMDILMVMTTIVLAVLTTMIAGVYPTWRACHVAPAGQLKTQ